MRHWLRTIIWIGLIGILASVAAGGIAVAVIWRNLPQPEELFARRVVQSTKIYDRTGKVLLYEVHGEERRTVVPFSEVSEHVKEATIAIEDANFYSHSGLSLRGILRAAITNLRAGSIEEGGSTITQQLIKKSFLTDEQSWTRKFKEAILAIALDARFPKDQIFAAYLNQIPYGSNAYGIEAAAETFFGKDAKDLTTAQAALLASLPQAPSYYSPYGQHQEDLFARKNYVIDRMAALDFITDAEAAAAKAEELKFLEPTDDMRAPHFVMHVREYLAERYGQEELERGGLIVTTTLDWEWQEEAERVVREYGERNETLIKAHNMALVAVDPTTGDILAMVGSAAEKYFSDPEPKGCAPGVSCLLDPQVNAALRLRQPGSAFKPFVYAAAFEKGFTPDTVLFDVFTEFNTRCGPDGLPRPQSGANPEDCYHPRNYDNTFRGPVTLRQSIAQSLNVPSVKLLYLTGVDDAMRTASALGITTLGDARRYGLSLVLGGAEVRLLDMVSAYGVFANDGVRHAPSAILSVKSASGEILEEKKIDGHLVIDQNVARIVNDVLSDNDARIPTFQPRSSLYFPDVKVAAKTGTTQDYRDAWTVGYTPRVAIGVWVGNSNNDPIQQEGSGVMAAAPAWHDFMAFALNHIQPAEFTPPESQETDKPILRGIWQGGQIITIDSVSQKLATPFTPPELRREVAYGEPHDPLYWIDRRDPSGPAPDDPTRDPQYENWEAAFRGWLGASGFTVRPVAEIPRESDDIHTPEKQPQVSVEKISPPDDSGVVLRVGMTAPHGVREVLVVAGERILLSRQSPPPQIEFRISQAELPSASSILEVRAYDPYGNMGRASVAIP